MIPLLKKLFNKSCRFIKTDAALHGANMYQALGQPVQKDLLAPAHSPLVAGIINNIVTKTSEWEFDPVEIWYPNSVEYQYAFKHSTGIRFRYILEKFTQVVRLKIEPPFPITSTEEDTLKSTIKCFLVEPKIKAIAAEKEAELNKKLSAAIEYFTHDSKRTI